MALNKDQLKDRLEIVLHLEGEEERNEGVDAVLHQMLNYFDADTLNGFLQHVEEEYGYAEIEDDEDIEEDEE